MDKAEIRLATESLTMDDLYSLVSAALAKRGHSLGEAAIIADTLFCDDGRCPPDVGQELKAIYEERVARISNRDERFKPPPSGTPGGVDKGIEREVMILWENGIDTYQSCEGGCRSSAVEGGVNGTWLVKWTGSTGHSYPVPTVCFHGLSGEGFKAYAIAKTFGLKVATLRRVYTEQEGELVGPHWEMTFCRPGKCPK